MKVLIIEENAAMSRLLRELIEQPACAVSECHDGAQALAACAAAQPDWVLLDLMLAATDALALTRQISVAYPQARLAVINDDDDARLRVAARRAGACGYVLKENLFEVQRLLASDDVIGNQERRTRS